MIKNILLLLVFLSCSGSKKIYEVEIKLPNTLLKTVLEVNESDKEAILYNGLENIELDFSQTSDGLLLEFPFYNSVFQIQSENLKGEWKRDYRGKVTAYPISLKEINKNIYQSSQKIIETKYYALDDGKVLVILEHEKFYSATVLSNTGDYRYIASLNKNFPLSFYGFDGAFALSFVIKELKDSLPLSIKWANSTDNYTAILSEKKSASDNTSVTEVESSKNDSLDELDFEFERLDGKSYRLKKHIGTPKIIQVFGSWCPNCIDESRFLAKWLDNNPDIKIDLITVSFEREMSRKKAIKSIEKVKKHFGLDNIFLLASVDPKISVNELMPQIKNFKAFPTTLFLDKDHIVRDIHTGFNGPATGSEFEKFKEEFKKSIKLIK